MCIFFFVTNFTRSKYMPMYLGCFYCKIVVVYAISLVSWVFFFNVVPLYAEQSFARYLCEKIDCDP